MMVRAPDSVLWAAEQAELADAKAGSKPVTEKSDEERLKEMLDSSKYTDTH